MGKNIVFSQSITNMLTTYIGFAFGAVNTLFFYPSFFSQENYGLVSYLLSAATLVWPFMGFGIQNTLIKFYSGYTSKIEQEKLLSLALFFPLFIALVSGSVGLLIFDKITSYYQTNALVQPYIWSMYFIALAIAYFELFFAWSKLKLKSVFGNFMKEVFHRVSISVLLFLVYKNHLDITSFIWCMVGVYVFRMLVIMAYAFWLIPPRIRFSLPENFKSILNYSALIFIAGSVATVLLELDKVMLERFIPIELISVYAIGVYIASVIAVPARALHQIANPVSAKLLNTNKLEELSVLYKKSSSNLLIISGLIFCLIIGNTTELYQIIPENYDLGIWILLLLCVIKLYENMLGNANAIIFNADFYRWVLFIGVLVVLFAVLFNWVFIPKLGMLGAALASFIAFGIYNSLKLFIIQKKLHIQPFSLKTLLQLAVIFAISYLSYTIDLTVSVWMGIAIKSAGIVLIYTFLTYMFKFSEELNTFIKKLLFFVK